MFRPASVAAILAVIAACASGTDAQNANEGYCEGGCLCFHAPDCGPCSRSQSVDAPEKPYCSDGIAPCNIGFSFDVPADSLCGDRISKPITPAGAPAGSVCCPPLYPVTDAAGISDGATE